MPEISRFYGIVIKMYFNDHLPPHFHAYYGGGEALISIQALALMAGSLSARALGLVIEWTALHQRELLMVWEQAQALQPLGKIDPLP